MQQPLATLLTLLMFTAAAVSSATARGPKRIALVAGNSAYLNAGNLPNSANDATGIAEALRKVNFKVSLETDLNRSGMVNAVRKFGENARGAEAALFYYAGHGLQVDGENYLIPTDAILGTSLALDLELIPLKSLQRAMEQARTKIIILDACRDNPFARSLARALGTRSTGVSAGLAPVHTSNGTLISFSTEPGNVALDGAGRNSPFAEALITHIGDRGKDINAILIAVRSEVRQATANKQVPWEHSSLMAPFYFVRPDAVPQATKLERQFWASVKDDPNPEGWKRYLEKYPNGFYAALAQIKIERAELDKRYEEKKEVEQNIKETLQQMRELRSKLTKPKKEEGQARERARKLEEAEEAAKAKRAQELTKKKARDEEEARKQAEEKARKDAEAQKARKLAEERARKEEEEARKKEEQAAEKAKIAEQKRKEAEAMRAEAKRREKKAEEEVRRTEARRPARKPARWRARKPARRRMPRERWHYPGPPMRRGNTPAATVGTGF